MEAGGTGEHGCGQILASGHGLGLEAGGTGGHQVRFLGEALGLALAAPAVAVAERDIGCGEHEDHRCQGRQRSHDHQCGVVQEQREQRDHQGHHAERDAGHRPPVVHRRSQGDGRGPLGRYHALFIVDHGCIIGVHGPA